VFYDKNAFPSKYQNGAFVAQHGSWNRSVLSGYRVIFVPFKNGRPSGPPEDFLTGFIADLERTEVHGRPVGLALLPDGSMLVSDDSSNTIWKVDTVK
jgi:glucose/arabinose dehydrogenase